MYKSPIEIICGQMETQMEGDILRAVQNFGINVDKEELLRALQYDRDQYENGYADGRRRAIESILRCKDCKHYEKENSYCKLLGIGCGVKDFCSYGERRTDD